MMRLPVRIFSDLHLGHQASRIRDAESLRPLIAGAGTVIFNGDTWEELAEPWKERSAAMLVDLKKIIVEEGCDVVFVRGNHDPDSESLGHLTLADGRIVITHGDALVRNSSPWKREILSGAEVIDEIWKKYPQAEIDMESRLKVAREIAIQLPSEHYPKGRSLLARVIDAALPPKRAFAMLLAWINQAALGARFCEMYFPKAEFLVIGHFHRFGIHSKNGKTVINTGSFVVPSRASWVSWDGAVLATGMVIEHRNNCEMGGNLRSWDLFPKF